MNSYITDIEAAIGADSATIELLDHGHRIGVSARFGDKRHALIAQFRDGWIEDVVDGFADWKATR